MNATILRFGYPATLIEEYEHWVVLLRPAQPTLGSFVLVSKSEARSFPDLPEGAFAELQDAVADIEDSLAVGIRHERINYLMLMMVDPHVHFHVIPRYEDVRTARGVTVIDVGWPKMPVLDQAVELKPDQIAALVEHFRQCWPQCPPLPVFREGN